MSNRFNIRVYALIFNDRREVLLTDEFRFGKQFTKFPGGGLEFGEGPVDCIKRECMEEMGQDVEVVEHFYTTDFYQQSAFHANDQIISIYYNVELLDSPQFGLKSKRFDFDEMSEGAQIFRWRPVSTLDPEELTFPIDKKVVKLLTG